MICQCPRLTLDPFESPVHEPTCSSYRKPQETLLDHPFDLDRDRSTHDIPCCAYSDTKGDLCMFGPKAHRPANVGPEMDRLILRRVFGDYGSTAPDPPYSTDRILAMDVFFKVVEMTGHAEIVCDMESYGSEPGDIVTVLAGLDMVWGYCGDLAEAVCRVALAAEIEEGRESP